MSITSNGKPVVVFEHQPDAPAGLFGEWLTARGIPWHPVRQGDPAPDPEAVAAMVTLGSSLSAYAQEPAWIPAHIALLKDAVEVGTPVLGICFGAQALAIALGGSVARAERPEVGWVAPQGGLPVLAGPWLAWHLDSITAPTGAEVLARSPDALQAYTVGPHLGVQFHPEVNAAIWNDWATRNRKGHLQYAGEPAALLDQITASEAALRARVDALFDWWREHAGQ